MNLFFSLQYNFKIVSLVTQYVKHVFSIQTNIVIILEFNVCVREVNVEQLNIIEIWGKYESKAKKKKLIMNKYYIVAMTLSHMGSTC